MSSTSMGNQTARIGFRARQMLTRVLATLAPAVTNLISGKPTKYQRCSLRTRAKQLVRNVAKALLVGITSLVKGMTVSATRMDVTSTLGGTVTEPFTDLGQVSHWIQARL